MTMQMFQLIKERNFSFEKKEKQGHVKASTKNVCKIIWAAWLARMRLEVAFWAFETYGVAYYISPLCNLYNDMPIWAASFAPIVQRKSYTPLTMLCVSKRMVKLYKLYFPKENTPCFIKIIEWVLNEN